MTSFIVVDTSGSMDLPASGTRRRIDVLATVLQDVLPTAPDARIVAFNDTAHEISRAALAGGKHVPEPGGGTMLAVALDFIAPLHPDPVIVICDGAVNDRQDALAAARRLNCVINTCFVGDERDRAAVGFMRTLALCSRRGIGQARLGNLRRPEQLAGELRLLLAGPAR